MVTRRSSGISATCHRFDAPPEPILRDPCQKHPPSDLEGTREADGIATTIRGFGSLGASLGGQAPNRNHIRAELRDLSIGAVALGRVDATVREAPPSLIGAAILHHFVMTLDVRSQSAWLDSYRPGPYRRPTFGFGLQFSDPLAVALVWDASAASDAGLHAGLELTAINDQPTELSCETINHALEAMSGETIELRWDGGSATIRRR